MWIFPSLSMSTNQGVRIKKVVYISKDLFRSQPSKQIFTVITSQCTTIHNRMTNVLYIFTIKLMQ